ncbi:MAG: alanine racemase [Tissierellia bacterium]|nr:alanine racemase [Tissierellia bacterium]MDD4726222.1 alanine racemase [Tissierellia bacterium]
MVKSKYQQIDTPALLIDKKIMESNIQYMQDKVNSWGINLRPHTKTHKMPELAKLQMKAGAVGITVAKVGEAEVMAEDGLTDIFIANEIIGESKIRRIRNLSETINISFGLDSVFAVKQIDKVFEGAINKANVLVEIETGENRSGVIEEETFLDIINALKEAHNIHFKGVFSHEGHSYGQENVEECKRIFIESQERTLAFAKLAEDNGFKCEVVSIGSTPSAMHGDKTLEGITEFRPGTYILMDVGQANAIGTYERCAATVLTTIISKPTDERIIGDAGAKALTAQSRPVGLTHTEGKGFIKGSDGVYVNNVYDEHTIIYDNKLHDKLEIGDKIEIIPNHICPVCNLYDEAYLVSDGQIVSTILILGRGKIQ